MSKVAPSRKQYRSMRGKMVDIEMLRKRNELTPAVGNARVNARGDELGPGGKIIRKREEVIKEHYAQAGKVSNQSGRAKPLKQEEIAAKIEEELTAEETAMIEDDAWLEDEEGNFVKKGK
jgi:hypothetical protein